MSVYRTVQTDFWKDPKIMEDFTPEDKLFYLYLLTNPNTTQCGIYGITKKEMAFQLGYSTETVNALMDRFITYHKLIDYHVETRELVIFNWAKYNFKRGGKPVQDLIKSELAKVKHQPYIEIVGKHVPIDGIRQVYESYYVSYDDSCHESNNESSDESTHQSCNESSDESSNEKSLNQAIPKENDESYHESYDESSEKNGQTETKTKTESKTETKPQPQQQEKEKPTNDAVVAVQLSDVVAFFEQNISTATPYVISELEEMIKESSYESVRYALEEAVARERRSLNYVKRIVDRCIAQKLFTFDLIRLEESRRQQRQGGTNPDAKTPEWLAEEERESREHAARKKAELESEVPGDDEIETMLQGLKGGTTA